MIWVVTPAFCKAELLANLLRHIEPEIKQTGVKHVVIDNHYPIDKEKNREDIEFLAAAYGSIYIDSGKDLGLHEGLNNAMKQLPIDYEKDIWLGIDPDDRPQTPNYIEAVLKVSQCKSVSFAILALHNYLSRQREEENVFIDREVEIMGEPVLIHPNCEMVNIAAYSLKWIKSIGGFSETLPYYGTMEATLHRKWKEVGGTDHFIGYLKNHHARTLDKGNPNFFDTEYSGWKLDHVQGIWKGDFESWLINCGKRDLIG